MHESVVHLSRLDTNDLKVETKKCIAIYESSIMEDPTRVDLYYSLSHLYISAGRSKDSVELLTKLNEILPDCTVAKFNLAMALKDYGDAEQALEILQNIDSSDEDFMAKVKHSIAHLHVFLLNFKEGWDVYDSRWDDSHFPSKNLKELNSKIPCWDGTPVKHLLIWAEQGLGDEVMFATALEDASHKCNKLTVACDKRLIPIFKRSFPDDIEFLPKSASAIRGSFDAQIPIDPCLEFSGGNYLTFLIEK